MDRVRVSVVGLGKLGAPLALAVAAKGHQVVGLDIAQTVVDSINQGKAPVFEPGLQALLDEHSSRVRATTDMADAIAATDLTFVLVATPSEPSGAFSLRYLQPACDQLGRELAKKDAYHLVVITSTVLPGSTDGEIRRVLEASAGKRAGADFGLCYSPEFIALGSVLHDLTHPDFGLIGESDERAGSMLESFYRGIYENDAPIARMSPVNAEITKLAVNTFVTTKISFANMVAGVCERLPGADVDVVTGALGLDRRIGSRYLTGALGYGGPCFPRDNLAFTHLADTLGAPSGLASATDAFNRTQVPHLLDVVRTRLSPDDRVAILGVAYKPETDVVEESQGLLLAKALIEAGIEVLVYDPAAGRNAEKALGAARVSHSAEDAMKEARVIVLTTPWPEFANLDFRTEEGNGKKIIVDCWRMLDRSGLSGSVEYVALGVGE